MANTLGSRVARFAIGLLVLLTAASAGCSPQPSSEDGKGDGSVCPTCRRTVGGETGDFGASIVPCGYAQREVDVAEAEALGYPAKAVARAAGRPIDMPMTWMPLDSKGGGAASGYESHTRVFVALSIDSFVYNELDIDSCDRMFPNPEDNASCRSNTAAGACASPAFIVVSGSGEVHTSDGAVTAALPSQILEIMLPGYDSVSFAPQVDLHDVRGTLRLDPAIPEPHIGFLYLSIEYTPSAMLRYGVLDVMIMPEGNSLDGGYRPPRQSDYEPIKGVWGVLPADDAAQVGRPSDAGTR